MMGILLQSVTRCPLPAYLPNRSTLRLKDISDPNQVAPDGLTIEGRMQTLCTAAADDIQKCANVCDLYGQ